jgi:hypothetical protein
MGQLPPVPGPQETEENDDDAENEMKDSVNGQSTSAPPAGGRTRGARAANMNTEEWARQRKDNHASCIALIVSLITDYD